ncbi:hypothetical protein [Flagellimonas algicola]|uniref:hypothetical protein n=1 Tax=Flagellimonas algicola TaxID=2583815 RepID=UPI001386C848|nr:hypothetical protein [Allomuricauda algicola]
MKTIRILRARDISLLPIRGFLAMFCTYQASLIMQYEKYPLILVNPNRAYFN